MDKVLVVYWSQTGNTETMANMLVEGIEEAGAQAELIEASDVDVDTLLSAKAFALGCPAMGAEELEDSVVEPLVAELEGKVSGKSLVLFGSYDWGDGEWMRTWTDRMVDAGATIITGQGIIANNEPDDDAKAALKEAGAQLAAL